MDHPPTPGEGQTLLYHPRESSHSNGTTEKPTFAPDTNTEAGKAYANPDHVNKAWLPIPLRGWFTVVLATFMIAAAIALEIALMYSKRKNGWPTKAGAARDGLLHYAFTLPPTAVVMMIVALWGWADLEIKKVQPYIDLAHGNAKPENTLLLDYTSTSNYILWLKATRNRHYLVALSATIVMMGLVCQPFAAALITVKDIWLPVNKFQSTTSLVKMGQNPTALLNLVPFASASGYAGAAALFNLGDPKFIKGEFAVAEFDIPTEIGNGTAVVKTVAVKSNPNCQAATTVTVTPRPGGVQLNGTLNGCRAWWNIETTTSQIFGSDTVRDCDDDSDARDIPDQYKKSVYWLSDFSIDAPIGKSAVIFCDPELEFHNVQVSVNVQTQLINSVTVLDTPFTEGGNVTGAPMNGRALNGFAFEGSDSLDFLARGRINTTRSILPTAIFQYAVQTNTVSEMFDNNAAGWANLTNHVYAMYLSLIAQGVYFVEGQSNVPMEAKSFQARVILSDVSVHVLTAFFLSMAIVGLLVNFYHRRERQFVDLRHSPGTIASAAAIISHTDVGEKLHARQNTQDIIQAFRDKRFRMDRDTGKIIIQGDEGYENAQVPNYNRRSVWGFLGVPASPRTPRPAP